MAARRCDSPQAKLSFTEAAEKTKKNQQIFGQPTHVRDFNSHMANEHRYVKQPTNEQKMQVSMSQVGKHSRIILA